MANRVLVVEDEPLIAFDVADHLTEAGFDVAGPVATVSAALALLEKGCDVAVLDVNLGRETAAPIAEAMSARLLPFVAVSGYSSDQLPDAFQNAPVLTKPVDPRRLVAEIRRCVNAR